MSKRSKNQLPPCRHPEIRLQDDELKPLCLICYSLLDEEAYAKAITHPSVHVQTHSGTTVAVQDLRDAINWPADVDVRPPEVMQVVGYEPDMVNHPPHYTRGPLIKIADCDTFGAPRNWAHNVSQRGDALYLQVECIDIIRHVQEPRLFTAMKYIWRVAFGGKAKDREDIDKARWYLTDWLEHPVGNSEKDLPPT